jgi:predicted amidohydrolase
MGSNDNDIAVTVHLVQFDVAWENREANHAKVQTLLDQCSPARNGLVVLPEMFATGFSMDVARTADDARATERFCRSIAAQHGCFVVAGLTQRRDATARGRNCALVIDPAGHQVVNYRKIHPFSLSREDQHFEAGDQVETFECNEFTVAPFICYDLRFPEIFRTAVRRGANLFCVIANWPDSRIEHWLTLLRARAIENQAYAIGVNRVGLDPMLRYGGRSVVVDPMGQIVADAGENECVIRAEIQVDEVAATRNRFPFLKDMRK